MGKRLALVLLIAVCASCSKTKGPANAPSVKPDNHRDSTVHVTATINGFEWKTDTAYGYTEKYSGNDSAISNLLINAYQSSSSRPTSMTFNITAYHGPNAYTINPPINTAVYYIGAVRHYATHGVIVVKTDTAYALRGSFYFTADTITVSNGEFDVALP